MKMHVSGGNDGEHRGLNGWSVATVIKVKCWWGVHTKISGKFERPKIFSIGNSKEFGIGVV
jgi:hypothetical protein